MKHWLVCSSNDNGVLGAIRALEGRGFAPESCVGVGINGTDCIVELEKAKPTSFYGSMLLSAKAHGYQTSEMMYKWIKDGVEPPLRHAHGRRADHARKLPPGAEGARRAQSQSAGAWQSTGTADRHSVARVEANPAISCRCSEPARLRLDGVDLISVSTSVPPHLIMRPRPSRFDRVSMEFPGVKALTDVSFDVRDGSVHALMGENGAGKSTLLKILSGAYRPPPATDRSTDSRNFHTHG